MIRGKFRLPLAAVLLFLLMATTVRVDAQAPGWMLQTVLGSPNVGDCSVTKLDALGNPNILYYDTTLLSLFYIKFNGSSWSTPIEVDHTHSGHMLCSGGMVLQSTGKPAVVYVTDDNHLFYVPMTGSTFQPQEIISPLTGPMHSPNLALGPGDSPLVVYAQNTFLVYAYRSAAGWAFEQPAKNTLGDKVLIGEHSPINILRDSQGNLHLSYYCMKHHPWYLERTPPGFINLPVRMEPSDTMNVDDTRPSIALALNPAGQPYVSATVGLQPQLKLYSRTCTGTTCTWSGQVIDQLPDRAVTSEISWVRLAYNSKSLPTLTYYYRDASGAAGLRLLRFNGQYWSKTMIDNRVNYGRRAWLVLNSADQAQISYFAGGLIYATEGTATVYRVYFPAVGR